MAGEREDLFLRLLREMREGFLDVKRGQEKHESELQALRKEIHDWQETIATTSGFAMHANIRNQQPEQQIEALTKRVEKLEEVR